MRRAFVLGLAVVALAGLTLAQVAKKGSRSDFQITASYIEACSCDMFCPCYFNPHSTHKRGGKHYCEANLVMKVNKGYYKNVKLDGVKVWIATDLGDKWPQGQIAWLALTFDPSVTQPQRDAMIDILPKLYAPNFKLLGIDAAPIEWRVDEAKGEAIARIGDGKKGEVVLDRWKGPDPKKESVLTNVKYFNAQSNTGFRMWKNHRQFYNNHGKKFETKDTNGFLITITFSGQAKQTSAD